MALTGVSVVVFFFAFEDVSYLITVYLNVAYIWGTIVSHAALGVALIGFAEDHCMGHVS